MHYFQNKHERCAEEYESRKNVWRKSTINNNKILKIDLMKVIKFSMKGTRKEHKTRGPRATIRSPEWHSHCRHADVMQHFSNPIIATNENIIIWTVLSFEEEYMGLTVNGAWSFE